MTESAETDENIVTSDKEHHDNLSYHHSDKHAERINRSITDTWRIAIQRLVGVSKRHRIRHTSTEDSADTAEVILLGLQDDETYDKTRIVAPSCKGYTSTISCSGTFKQITSPTE